MYHHTYVSLYTCTYMIRTYPLGDTVPLVPTVGTVDYMIPIGRGGDLLVQQRETTTTRAMHKINGYYLMVVFGLGFGTITGTTMT